MKKIKTLLWIVIAIVIAGGIVWISIDQYDIFKLKSKLFAQEELKIDPTESVVEEIKNISEFTTACYFEEYVLQTTKEASGNTLTKWVKSTPEVVILSKGKVRAGVDLSKVSNEDIRINGDTLSMRIPQAEIFDVIVNPSDYEIFIETGDWTHDEITKLVSQGREKVKNNALKDNIIEKAQESSRKKLEKLFKTLGFKQVEIITS